MKVSSYTVVQLGTVPIIVVYDTELDKYLINKKLMSLEKAAYVLSNSVMKTWETVGKFSINASNRTMSTSLIILEELKTKNNTYDIYTILKTGISSIWLETVSDLEANKRSFTLDSDLEKGHIIYLQDNESPTSDKLCSTVFVETPQLRECVSPGDGECKTYRVVICKLDTFKDGLFVTIDAETTIKLIKATIAGKDMESRMYPSRGIIKHSYRGNILSNNKFIVHDIEIIDTLIGSPKCEYGYVKELVLTATPNESLTNDLESDVLNINEFGFGMAGAYDVVDGIATILGINEFTFN